MTGPFAFALAATDSRGDQVAGQAVMMVRAPAGAVTRPNLRLTPGSTDGRIDTRLASMTICQPVWLRSVLEKARRLAIVKRAHLARYGIRGSSKSYVLDRLVPVELGGAISSGRNLWPEHVSVAGRRDRLERRLNRLVCAGKLSLLQARQRIIEAKTRNG